jgi:predicted O-methyltransferase YrrM
MYRVSAIASRVRQVVHSTQDTQALQELAPLSDRFLPWTTFSMRPTAILSIVNDICINNRVAILEFGSGNSTVFAARALAQLGAGQLVSLDHDQRWAEATRAALEREGLEKWATVTHAPLVDDWYDRDRLPTPTEIDLLVIDGPPAFAKEKETARQPALDVFHDVLVDGATIVLDDSRRPGERQVVERWHQSHGIKLRDMPGGQAIGKWAAPATASI